MAPTRILHVVSSLNRGGVETWLMHVLRHIDRQRFRMDFVVHTTAPGAYGEEARALGSRIIPCLKPSQPWRYVRNLRRILREEGPYDVVHSHINYFSGLVLRVAARAGVPARIAHLHTDLRQRRALSPFLVRAFMYFLEPWVLRYPTAWLACSGPAAASLFGQGWQADPRVRVLLYAVHVEPFRQHVDRASVRAELGLPPDAFVVAHVGRFVRVKNHAFLLRVAAEVVRREPSARFLLVGEGPLMPRVKAEAARLGLADQTLLAGVRPDVPRLMLGAMDAFLFPSLYEGMPLVLVEAQAAGVPCVYSDTIGEEADVVKPLLRRMSLRQPPGEWAEALLAMRGARNAVRQGDALAAVDRSHFNLSAGLAELEKVYLGQ